jgi:hypothetical protein
MAIKAIVNNCNRLSEVTVAGCAIAILTSIRTVGKGTGSIMVSINRSFSLSMTVHAVVFYKVTVIGIIYPKVLRYIVHDWIRWSIELVLGRSWGQEEND